MEPTTPPTAGAAAGVVLPAPVRRLVVGHLRRLDRGAPGLVELLYLTGSVALGDYWHGVSDVDFLAVTSRPLDDGALAVVGSAHQGMPVAPLYDGVYLERGALAALADDCPGVPHVVGGVFRTGQPCGEVNPALWLTLARCGVVVRGPSPVAVGVRAPDTERLRWWNLDNLKSYWQPLAGRIRQAMAGRTGDAAAEAGGVAWAVLGPARLHYTLATGEVISKSGAGRYAAHHFPAWAELAGRAVTWRQTRRGWFTTVDALAAAAMVDTVVEDAWQRWG
jgi:hypothetical protein